MNRILTALLVFLLFVADARAQPSGIRGDIEAVTAARRMVEQAGGAELWRSRTFELLERGYLNNGDILDMRISYDFARGARRIESTSTTGGATVEWLAPDSGWFERDGAITRSNASELAMNVRAIQQEPYPIYHRIARNDRRLRVELRNNGSALYVFDEDERLLCWFGLWPNGQARSWANFYNGVIGQQFYGPSGRVGAAVLPLWGVQQDGSFRFEHLDATFGNTPLAAPRPRSAPARNERRANMDRRRPRRPAQTYPSWSAASGRACAAGGGALPACKQGGMPARTLAVQGAA